MKLVGLLASIAFTAQAHAGTMLSCTYLTKPDGAPYPGLSRPQVHYDETRVDVEIVMEAGRGTVSRVNYLLMPAARAKGVSKFVDSTQQISFTSNRNGGTLNVKGLISRCAL